MDTTVASPPASVPDFPALRACWHPVGYAHEFGAEPRRVRLLGEEIVVWRDSTGTAHALRDLCIHRGTALSLGRVVGDRIRPKDKRDPLGVAEARAQMKTALGMIEHETGAGPWAIGEPFTMADCAALPALHYANRIEPLAKDFPNAAAYLTRLEARPSIARVLKEAEPYFNMVPKEA